MTEQVKYKIIAKYINLKSIYDILDLILKFGKRESIECKSRNKTITFIHFLPGLIKTPGPFFLTRSYVIYKIIWNAKISAALKNRNFTAFLTRRVDL